MRKWTIEILYPFEDAWLRLDYIKPYWTRNGAEKRVTRERLLFTHPTGFGFYEGGTKFRVTNALTGESHEVE